MIVGGPASVPPAPSTVTPSHPLLVRHAESHGVGGNTLAARVHRAAGRQRGSYRFNPSTQTLHLHYNPTNSVGGTSGGANNLRGSNPPALLQR